ncbi:hypothetical protein [Candidatus Cardinium hertigii]
MTTLYKVVVDKTRQILRRQGGKLYKIKQRRDSPNKIPKNLS